MHATAAELWRTWIRTKVIQPRSHDSDLAETVGARLHTKKVSGIPAAMDAAGWVPRDLLLAIAGELQSFSGMLQGLLTFYERVGARSATGENLRISYEFVEGEPFDLLLSNFREQVADVRSAVRQLATPLRFDPEFAFRSPMNGMWEWDEISELFGTDDFHTISLPRTAPRPSPTGATHADEVIERGLRVVDVVFALLAGGGPTLGGAIARLWRQGESNETDVEAAVVQAATDWWPLSTTASLHGLASIVRQGRGRAGLVDEVNAWLDNFESTDRIEVTVDRLVDVLSLPSWGMRHDLYAAWIATQVNQALPTDRLTFVVVNETLRFPFKATKLATAPAADAACHELWCEMRSDLLSPSGMRVRGIQPDYRVLHRKRDGSATTVLAIEVKQYRSADAKKHGGVLAMYAAGLPDAEVFLVGHGPIGDARKHVPPGDRVRTTVFEHVRPGREADAAAFRTAVTELLPLPKLERLELTWDSRVHDLDLHMSIGGEAINWQKPTGEVGKLRADAFWGGPEVIDLTPGLDASTDVEVHLFSSDVISVLAAQPRVTITWVGGKATVLRPSKDLPPGEERRWVVCRVEPDGTLTLPRGTTIYG